MKYGYCYLRCLVFLFLSAFRVLAAASDPDSLSPKLLRLEWIPAERMIPAFTADQRTHRLSVQYVFNQARAEFIGSMGAKFPVANIHILGKPVQCSVASTLYTTLLRSISSGDLINTDFFVDLFFDLQLKDNLFLRSGAGHTSQHFSDDALKKFGNLAPINYVRDYYQLMLIRKAQQVNALFYGGVYYNHNFKTSDSLTANDKSGTPMLQIGLEHVPFRISRNGQFFWAADFKLRGEFDYSPTSTLQAGLKFSNSNGSTARLCFTYGAGYEERGQFYLSKRELLTFGLFFEL